jgi:uncharacterized protein YeaO (DUF488 family)
MIKTKRVYEKPAKDDGARYLVERLWPRGVAKGSLKIEAWLKEVAPSADLRRWFSHDPAKWQEFRRKYFAELDAHPDAWAPLLQAARRGPVTLVYSARDPEHNNAIALASYLDSRMREKAVKHQERE